MRCSEILIITTLLLLTGCMSAPAPTPEVAAETIDPVIAGEFSAAVAAYETGDPAGAATALQDFVDRHPGYAAPRINLAMLAIEAEDYSAAAQTLDDALAAGVNHCDVRVLRGYLARRALDFTLAETHYRACLDAMPDHPGALRNLGVLYEIYLGDAAAAADCYRRYLAQVEAPLVASWLRLLEAQLGQDDQLAVRESP